MNNVLKKYGSLMSPVDPSTDRGCDSDIVFVHELIVSVSCAMFNSCLIRGKDLQVKSCSPGVWDESVCVRFC